MCVFSYLYFHESDEKVPVLILKGLWLRDAGFEIGDRIVLSEENGKLVIENKGKGFGKPYSKEKKMR